MVLADDFIVRNETLMIFSSSWNFPRPDGLFMRETVFSFSSECGEGEKTEAGAWK